MEVICVQKHTLVLLVCGKKTLKVVKAILERASALDFLRMRLNKQ